VFARGSYAATFERVSVIYTAPAWACGFWLISLRASDLVECYCGQADSAFLLEDTKLGLARIFAADPANTNEKIGVWAYHGSGGDDISICMDGFGTMGVKFDGCDKLWISSLRIYNCAVSAMFIGTDVELTDVVLEYDVEGLVFSSSTALITYIEDYLLTGDVITLTTDVGYASPSSVTIVEGYLDGCKNGVIVGPNSVVHLEDYVGVYDATESAWIIRAGGIITSLVTIEGWQSAGYGILIEDGGLLLYKTAALFDLNVTGEINLDGVIPLTMAADFIADGDSATNVVTNSRMARKDSL